MKKTMVLLLALTIPAMAMLTGCGEIGNNHPGATNPPGDNDILPDAEDLIPDVLEPDRQDGEIHDRDGIITEADNGIHDPVQNHSAEAEPDRH